MSQPVANTNFKLRRDTRHEDRKDKLHCCPTCTATGKLPLSLPSPRACDPAPLEDSQVYIAFSKAYKRPSEMLQKYSAN